MSNEGRKVGRTIRLILNILLIPQYLYLLFLILSSFPFVPWYDPGGRFLTHYLILWVPLCVTTLALAVCMIVSRVIYRPRLILLCFNALIIPLTYLIEMTGISWLLYLLRFTGMISIVLYVVLCVIAVKRRNI
ncbi:MAG: hypothetical protein IJS94_06360 [Clostridia bacterium]|nr:hypothetical protein [Clostridia bacterium]